MKTLTFIALLIIVIGGVAGFLYLKKEKPASKEQLEQVRKELVQKIDSLAKVTNRIDVNIDSVKCDIRKINSDVDTLKNGQVIIYDQVKKTPKSFWDWF